MAKVIKDMTTDQFGTIKFGDLTLILSKDRIIKDALFSSIKGVRSLLDSIHQELFTYELGWFVTQEYVCSEWVHGMDGINIQESTDMLFYKNGLDIDLHPSEMSGVCRRLFELCEHNQVILSTNNKEFIDVILETAEDFQKNLDFKIISLVSIDSKLEIYISTREEAWRSRKEFDIDIRG